MGDSKWYFEKKYITLTGNLIVQAAVPKHDSFPKENWG